MIQDYRRSSRKMAQAILCTLFFSLALGANLNAYANAKLKTVLVIGDSLSAEYGLPYGTGWVSLLKKKNR